MRVRAIADLSQLSDSDLFQEVASGLSHILDNAINLNDQANILLEVEKFQGYEILNGVAEEETAKFFILLDAIRCPRSPQGIFVRQLKRFNEHLAKGIYASCYKGIPASLGALIPAVDFDRQEYYLDGPDGCEWIFRNEILNRRESNMYVDYVEVEDGHQWEIPTFLEGLYERRWGLSSLPLAKNIVDSGYISMEALEVIAKIWRTIKISDSFTRFDAEKINMRVLRELDDRDLLIEQPLMEQPKETYINIVRRWIFPLYGVDMSRIEVSREELIRTRDDYFYREFYDFEGV